ncbi:MAG: signal peptidase I [Cellvibrionaceae bacterium]|nr:signal peptidase I [Cellvibrionaceae bacterium]
MKTQLLNFCKQNKYFFVFIALMFAFRSAIADWNDVPTGSMKPTIVEGDRIYVNKMAYDLRVPFTHVSLLTIAEPQRGDIIVFESQAADKRLVKRVIGLPGDIVELRQNRLFINGQALVYLNLAENNQSIDKMEFLAGAEYTVRTAKNGSRLSNFSPIKVPARAYLALGDNRDNSADSRMIGFVPRAEIVGKATHVVFSLNYDNYFLPRSGRFFHNL